MRRGRRVARKMACEGIGSSANSSSRGTKSKLQQSPSPPIPFLPRPPPCRFPCHSPSLPPSLFTAEMFCLAVPLPTCPLSFSLPLSFTFPLPLSFPSLTSCLLLQFAPCFSFCNVCSFWLSVAPRDSPGRLGPMCPACAAPGRLGLMCPACAQPRNNHDSESTTTGSFVSHKLHAKSARASPIVPVRALGRARRMSELTRASSDDECSQA